MFEVSVEHTFAAGHALREYRGKCENVHGHNYRVRVLVRGEKLDKVGMLADFTEMPRPRDGDLLPRHWEPAGVPRAICS